MLSALPDARSMNMSDTVGEARASPACPVLAHLTARGAKPIVHVRVRPTLAHLGESPDQKRVLCLDHKNIVVRAGGRNAPERPAARPSTPTPTPQSQSQSQSQSRRRRSNSVLSAPLPSPRAQGQTVTSGGRRARHTAPQPPRSLPAPDATPPPDRRRYSSVPRQRLLRGRRAAGVSGGFLDGFVTPRREAKEEHFSFDFVHGEDATQDEVFEESVLNFADMALLAQCISIVCYGPTGSGKTYSMMGSTQSSQAEGAASVRRSKTPGSVPSGKNNNVSIRRAPTRAPSAGLTTDATPSSRSSIHSMREAEWAAFLNNSNNSNSNSTLGLTRESAAGAQEAGDAMGLLPRLVRVLLDRRGEAVALDRVEPSGATAAAKGAPVKHDSGITNHNATVTGSSPAQQQQQQQQQQQLGLSLTLQELVFYGVELYMDEFHDLLDATKRPIPSIGISGGLEAFCQRLNGSVATQQQQTAPRSGNMKPHRTVSASASTTTTATSSSSSRGGGILISSVEDLRRCYRLASRNRVTKTHQRNDSSSRSHALFILQLRFDLVDSRDAANGGAPPRTVYSYVAMVDLAGSERVKDTRVEGEALREAQYINKSLSALSAVLLALYQGSSHVPYRDSKLTQLLRPCLEAGRVLALVHVPPCSADETISALQFAEQVRHKSVRSHNFDDANDTLVEIFEDLIDPELHAYVEAYRKTEIKHAQLCAEIRLAYLARDSTDSPLLQNNKNNNNEDASQDKNHNEAEKDYIEKNDMESDRARRRRRELAIRVLTARHLAALRAMEEEIMKEAIYTIEMEYEKQVEDAKILLDAKVHNLQSVVEKQRAWNAQLAEENSQPVLRDAYAMEITRRLKDTSTAVTECVREKLLLTECIRAVRQRLTLQGDLERCIDDQLKNYLPQTGTLSQHIHLQRSASPLAEDAYEDEETRALTKQQLLLARELSLLRQESTCFVRADEVWEGLWARAMREQMLVTAMRERLLLEHVAFSPAAVRWALRRCGVGSSVAAEIAADTTRREPPTRAFSAVDEAAAAAMTNMGSVSSTSIDTSPGVSVLPIAPLPFALGDKEVVHSGRALLGRRDDESKLQAAAVDMLLHDGIRVETLPAPLGDPVTGGGRGDPFEIFRTLPSANVGGIANVNPYRWQSGVLRLCPSPRDASSYALELVQGTATQGERRLFSIPLGEPQLCLSLHVLEEGGDPLVVLELRGAPPAATPGPMRLTTRSTDAIPGAAPLIPGDIALAQRLGCGGELLLPSTATKPSTEGSSIALRFSAPRNARADAVECVVAALAGVTVPTWGTGENANDNTQARGDGRSRVAYHHVPYVLLGGYGSHEATSLPRVLGVSPLAYACTLQITFYFSDAEKCNDEESDDTFKTGNSTVKGKGEVDTAVEALHSFAAITITPMKDEEADKDADGNRLLRGLQQIQAFRLETRARLRQHLFDAEDIKAELLYSYSDNEFMHSSHIRNVQREAREFIELERSQLNSPPMSVLRVTPAVCRELCGAAVPWTLWQWAYRWRTLQDTDAQRPRSTLKDFNHDDVIYDSFDGTERDNVSPVRSVECDTSIFFESLPGFLACMEI